MFTSFVSSNTERRALFKKRTPNMLCLTTNVTLYDIPFRHIHSVFCYILFVDKKTEAGIIHIPNDIWDVQFQKHSFSTFTLPYAGSFFPLPFHFPHDCLANLNKLLDCAQVSYHTSERAGHVKMVLTKPTR